MSNTPAIQWCGVCWLSGGRRLAAVRKSKLPLCSFCSSRFGSHKEILERLHFVWEWLPDFESADLHGRLYSEAMPSQREAIDIVTEQLNLARSLARGGLATSHLETVLNKLKFGSELAPEEIKYWEERECLRKGKRTLKQIKQLLRNPQRSQKLA